MFKNLKKVLFALVLAFVAAFAFACGETECPECGPEVNKENCTDFCETCSPEANEENCKDFCPEPEECDPEANKENCKDFQDYVVPTDFYMDVPDVTVGETVEVFLDEFAPANAYKGLVFVSSNPDYATVDAKGVVTGIRPGEVTITATSALDSKVSKEYTFEVKDAAKDLDVLKRELAYLQAQLPNFVTATYELPQPWNSNVEVTYTIDGAAATKIDVPANLAEDVKASINIEVSYNGESDSVAGVVVWVVKDANVNTFTRVEKAVAAADALMAEYTTGTKVAEDIILPATIFGCAMNWSSTNPAVIATDGKYVRPADDKAITLGISATYGANMVKTSYAVVAKGYSADEKVAYIKANTFANIDGKEVNTNLILPEYDTYFNAKLTYKSQSPDIVSDKGEILVYPTGENKVNVKFTVTVDYQISKNDNFTGEFEIALVIVPENEASKAINEWLAGDGKAYAAGIVHTPYGLDAENVLDLPAEIDWDVEAVKLAVKNQAEDEDLYQVLTLTEEGKVKLNAQYLRYTVVSLVGTYKVDPFTKASVNVFLNIGVSETPMVIYTGTWRSSDQGDGSLTEIQGAYDLTSNVSYFDEKVGYVKTTYGSGYWSGYVLQTEVDGQLWESYLMELMTVYIEKDEEGNVYYNKANVSGGTGGNWGVFFVNKTGEAVNIEVGTYGTSAYTLKDGATISSVGSRNNLAMDGYAPGFIVDAEGNVVHKSTDDKLEYNMENNKAYMGGKKYKVGDVITADLYAGMAKEAKEATYLAYSKDIYEYTKDTYKADVNGEYYYVGGDAKNGVAKVEEWTVVDPAWRCSLDKKVKTALTAEEIEAYKAGTLANKDAVKEIKAGTILSDAQIAEYEAGTLFHKADVKEYPVWAAVYTANENIKYVEAADGAYKKVTAEDGTVSYVAIAEGEELAEGELKYNPTYKAKDVLTEAQYKELSAEEKALVTVTYKNADDSEFNYVVKNLLGDSKAGTLVQYLTIPAGGYAMSWKYQFYGVGSAASLRAFTMPAEGQKVNVLEYDVHWRQSQDAEAAYNNVNNYAKYANNFDGENFVPTLENISKVAKTLETYAINARTYFDKLEDGSATKADVFPIEYLWTEGKEAFVENVYLEDVEEGAAYFIMQEIDMFLETEPEEGSKPEEYAEFLRGLAALYARGLKYTEELAGKRAELTEQEKEEGKVGAIVEAGLVENLKDLEDKYAEYEQIKFTIYYDYAGGYANSFIYYNQKDLLIPLFLKDLYDHMVAVGAFQTKVDANNNLVEDKNLETPKFEDWASVGYWSENYSKYATTLLSYYLYTPMYSSEGNITSASSAVKNEKYRDYVEGAKTFFNTEKGQYWLTLADWVDEGTRYGNGAGQDFWGRKGEMYADYVLLGAQPNYTAANGAINRHSTVAVTNAGTVIGAYRFAQYIIGSLGQAIYNEYCPHMVWASVFNRHDTQASFGTQKFAVTDTTIKLYDAPYREGYDFVGWVFADGEKKGELAEFDGTVFADVNVVAKWELQEGATAKDPVPFITVKFVNDFDAENPVVMGAQYDESKEVAPIDPGKPAPVALWKFMGWSTDPEATEATPVPEKVTEDTTFYSVWVEVTPVMATVVDPNTSGTVLTEFATIGEAVLCTLPGGTVTVKAGLYKENITIKSAVTILGPNAEKPGTANDRVAEAEIQGVITVNAGGVAIKGIKLSGTASKVLISGAEIDGVTVENCYVTGYSGNDVIFGDYGTIIKNLKVANNKFEWSYRKYAFRPIRVSATCENFEFTNNYMSNDYTGGGTFVDYFYLNAIEGDMIINNNNFAAIPGTNWTINAVNLAGVTTLEIKDNVFAGSDSTVASGLSLKALTEAATVTISGNTFSNMTGTILNVTGTGLVNITNNTFTLPTTATVKLNVACADGSTFTGNTSNVALQIAGGRAFTTEGNTFPA